MSTKSSPHSVPLDPRRRRFGATGPDQRAAAAPAAPKFQPIHMRRAFEEICERIREQLALGVLKPGDKLPPERDLAQQLGVSRNVLREALRSLEMAGLLRLQKGVKGGAFIQEGDTGRMNDVVRDMLSPRHDLGARTCPKRAFTILDLVVRLACANARRRPISTRSKPISSAPSLATREGRLLDRVECSREFYKLLAAATGNKVIAMIMEFGH